MSEWQPIETAPKDRTTILVWCDNDVYAVWWVSRLDEHGDAWNSFDGWGVSDNHNDPQPLRGSPSHWMPRPAAP